MKTIIIRSYILLFLFCCFSCTTKNKKNQIIRTPINLDSINTIFNDLNLVYVNYNHYYNLRDNYPVIIKRIDSLKGNSNDNVYTDLKRLIKLYSLKEKYRDKETDSLNNNIINRLLTKDQLKELRKLYKSTFSIDSTKPHKYNLNKLTVRIKRIDYYFKKQRFYIDSLSPKFWELCPIYYQLLDKISIEEQPKIDSLKNKILNIKTSFTENKNFIKSIIKTKKDSITPTYLKNIAPIFGKVNNQFGVYNTNLNYYGDKLNYNKSTVLKKFNKNRDILFTNKFVQDSSMIIYLKPSNIYAFSAKKRLIIDSFSFGIHPDECNGDYYIYPIKFKEKIKEKPLFSSTYKLDLEFKKFPKIDSIINKKFPDICLDCPSGLSKQKTFAKLKGYDNIYFAVTADKKIDDTQTTARAIYYISDNIIINLWMEIFDDFGCSCL